MRLRAKLTDITSAFGTTTVTITTNGKPDDIEKYLNHDCDIEIKRHRKHRSLQANAMLWACITELADAMKVPNWDMYRVEIKRWGVGTMMYIKPEALPILKRFFRVVDEICIKDGMQCVICYYGSSSYNTKEMSRLIDGVLGDMREVGLETPEDEEIQAILEDMRKEEARKNDQSDGPAQAGEGIPD